MDTQHTVVLGTYFHCTISAQVLGTSHNPNIEGQSYLTLFFGISFRQDLSRMYLAHHEKAVLLLLQLQLFIIIIAVVTIVIIAVIVIIVVVVIIITIIIINTVTIVIIILRMKRTSPSGP